VLLSAQGMDCQIGWVAYTRAKCEDDGQVAPAVNLAVCWLARPSSKVPARMAGLRTLTVPVIVSGADAHSRSFVSTNTVASRAAFSQSATSTRPRTCSRSSGSTVASEWRATAGGHGMWGIPLGPATGELLAELIDTGEVPQGAGTVLSYPLRCIALLEGVSVAQSASSLVRTV
jgi:hypothetical protein